MPETVRIQGLREAQQAIKVLGEVDASREFRNAGKVVASTVISKAAGRASGLGPMWERAAATMKPAALAGGAGIRFGAGFAGSMGAEFGAARNQARNTGRGTIQGWNQFKAWRGSGESAGYFLWPTIHDDYPTILEQYLSELDPFFDKWFPGGVD